MGYFEDVKRWKDYRSGDPSNLHYLRKSVPSIITGCIKVETLKSLNLAKKTAELVRILTWGETPTINISSDDETLVNSINNVLSESKFNQMMAQYIECMAAEGGFFIKARPIYDGELLTSVALDFYPAEKAEPVSWTNNTLTSVNFIDYEDIMYKAKKCRAKIIENHTLSDGTYSIIYTVVIGKDELKPSQLGLKYEDQVFNNVTYPLFAYFKSPKTNSKSFDIMYGSSIYDGLEAQIELIDNTYNMISIDMKDNATTTVFSREAVPDIANLNDEASVGKYITQQRSYLALNFKADGEIINPVSRVSSSFNTDQIINALNKQLRIYEGHVGLSEGTFTDTGDVSKTATEVVSRESATYRTKSMFQQAISFGITDTINSILSVINLANGTDYGILGVDVKFYDAADQDNSAWITELDSAINAGLLTWKKAIMEFNSCDEATATQMMNEIIAERKLKEGQVVETGTIKTTEV